MGYNTESDQKHHPVDDNIKAQPLPLFRGNSTSIKDHFNSQQR